MTTAELASTDPVALVPGDPGAVEAAAANLRARSKALQDVGTGLRSVRVESWHGRAAQAFERRMSQQPPKWISASDALVDVAGALTAHAEVLRWGQGQAAEAIELWQGGDPLGAQALLAYTRGEVARGSTQLNAHLQSQASHAPTTREFDPPVGINDVLDIPLSNADGEHNGGVNPQLPTDLTTLQKLLDSARAAKLDPTRYATLLQQYWLVKAANIAGIDLNAWDPAAGSTANLDNGAKVYRFYGNLFLNNPSLQWAGLANMIGPTFAAGIQDLQGMQGFASQLARNLDTLPSGVQTLLPPGLAQLAAVSGQLTAQETGWFDSKFLAMQKHIFIDMAPQHEAYLNAGLSGIDEIRRAGLIDNDTNQAWIDINRGDPAHVQQGNTRLASREQNQVIANQYDQMYQHDGPIGAAVTYGMTAVGAASIPGTRTPAEYHPINLDEQVNMPGQFRDESIDLRLSTPLPDFNISDRAHRWDYITNDSLLAYQRLVHDNPDLARQIIASPVEQRVAAQHLQQRWPTITDDLLTHWQPSIELRGPLHGPR